MFAESAYIFRHALLRDAAYQLQLPRDRARLHRIAFALIEGAAGDRAPAPPAFDEPWAPIPPHGTDAVAEELAGHAAHAGMASERKLYMGRAAIRAGLQFRNLAAESLWRDHAAASTGAERGESLRRAGLAALVAGRTSAAEPLLDAATARRSCASSATFRR
ncbi:MAG: hypothetical protein HYY18_18655 [Planctomycetes bacterium]|nr:hypothetical protein [Planctomycetota bacterium]